MCDRVAVMYLGKIVEIADADQLYEHPRHPYTGALLSRRAGRRPAARGAASSASCSAATCPSPTNPPQACRFHTRCPKASRARATSTSRSLEVKQGGNVAACHFPLTDEEIQRRVPTAAA